MSALFDCLNSVWQLLPRANQRSPPNKKKLADSLGVSMGYALFPVGIMDETVLF